MDYLCLGFFTIYDSKVDSDSQNCVDVKMEWTVILKIKFSESTYHTTAIFRFNIVAIVSP